MAEQAILLMLMLLRRALEGDRAVREGRQMEMKERCMVEGLTELSACKVGLWASATSPGRGGAAGPLRL